MTERKVNQDVEPLEVLSGGGLTVHTGMPFFFYSCSPLKSPLDSFCDSETLPFH